MSSITFDLCNRGKSRRQVCTLRQHNTVSRPIREVPPITPLYIFLALHQCATNSRRVGSVDYCQRWMNESGFVVLEFKFLLELFCFCERSFEILDRFVSVKLEF